jgi:hypothetical protein
MRTKFTSLIVVAVCGLLLAGCCTAHHSRHWEYKVVKAPHPPPASATPEQFMQNEEAFLNDLGKEGWVLVTHEGEVCYLKRAKR